MDSNGEGKSNEDESNGDGKRARFWYVDGARCTGRSRVAAGRLGASGGWRRAALPALELLTVCGIA